MLYVSDIKNIISCFSSSFIEINSWEGETLEINPSLKLQMCLIMGIKCISGKKNNKAS
jgi:hypothetical protein